MKNLLKNNKKEQDTNLLDRTYRVYMRDWYFNAGIVGFLEILLTDEEKDEIISHQESEHFSFREDKILIEENYIQFHSSVLAKYIDFVGFNLIIVLVSNCRI